MDEIGDVFLQMPVHDEVLKILDKHKGEFKKKFGREPGPGDPALFQTLLMSEEDYYDSLDILFAQAGIPAEFAYANRKTGITVTEMNKHLIPDIDIAKWNDAVKEFRDIKKGKKKIVRPDIVTRMEKLSERLEFCQYLHSLILQKQNNNSQRKSFDDKISKVEYLLFCLTKNLKTLRAALKLIETNFGEDALNLIRSIFENYLHIAMSIRNEDFINDIRIKIGLLWGTHEAARKNSEKVVEVATNKEHKLKYTKNHQLASLHPLYGKLDLNIYNYLYDFLSSFTHPDLSTLSCYVNEDGFDHKKRNFADESVLYITFINLLILNEVKCLEGIDPTSVLDIGNFTNTTAPHLIKIFEQIEQDFPGYPSVMRERIEALMAA